MNRWWGTSADSDRQIGERSARAARRTISKLPVVVSSEDDDDNFQDCDTSGLGLGLDNLNLNIDGEPGDIDETSSSSSTMSQAELAAELQRQKNLPVEDADYVNDDDAWKKELKIKFDRHDVN